MGLRVRDDTAQPLPAGEIGGIEVKGPNVFAGYWRMPEKTQEEFTADGWFKTGDVGKIDARGYVTIVGRSKDLIISGGYNVYPAEIEGYINEMPGVAEIAVIGVPHPDFGEAVVAVVVAKPGATLDGAAHRRGAEDEDRQLQGAQAGVRGRRTAAQHDGQGAEEPAARAAQGAVRRLSACARRCARRPVPALRRRLPLRHERRRALRLHRPDARRGVVQQAARALQRLPVPALPARTGGVDGARASGGVSASSSLISSRGPRHAAASERACTMSSIAWAAGGGRNAETSR